MSSKLTELKPNYFICRIHDFNSVYDIDDQQIRLDMFDVLDENDQKICTYILTSFIVYMPGHYICAFKTNESVVDTDDGDDYQLNNHIIDIKNDLLNRYETKTVRLGSLYSPNYQHTVGCYVRADLLTERI